MVNRPPFYDKHPGTLIISGTTAPARAGGCACHFLEQGITPIDFLCIGANANQQAVKSMGTMMAMVENDPRNQGIELSFRPLRVTVKTEDRNTPGIFHEKDATVWRLVLLQSSAPKNAGQ